MKVLRYNESKQRWEYIETLYPNLKPSQNKTEKEQEYA